MSTEQRPSTHPSPRFDPHLGTRVHVLPARQGRPNLPDRDCPFCVGGLEAPEPYDVRVFPNRWPSLGEGRCEVVLYSPDHEASFASIGATGIRGVIDVWAERTEALLSDAEVAFVLPFENRGAEIGATIPHPHGQIYAFDHVPDRQQRLLDAGWHPDPEPGDRLVAEHRAWRAWTTWAPVYPVSLVVAPDVRVATLTDLSSDDRDELAALLADVMMRFEHLFGEPPPYMLWVNQAPRGTNGWLHIEIVSPWRDRGVHRYIAAAEVATGEYFNPVDPVDIAGRLRALGS